MDILFTAVRKSDGKVLYFYDDNSREDYIDMYDEELTDYGFALNLPFGEKVIDVSPERSELRQMMHMVGLEPDKNMLQELYGNNDEKEDVDEKIDKMRRLSKHTFEIKDDKLEETDDDPYEIAVRKNKLTNVQIFQTFYNDLDEERKKAVRDVFADLNLDIDKLDEYIDEEINMNVDVYLQDYETSSAFEAAAKKYKSSAEYKKHKIFMDAIDKSYDVVYKMDEADDLKRLKAAATKADNSSDSEEENREEK